jgi:YjbE family integral membrane protein
MDILSLGFLYALGAIVVIDLVLAGDNAIVIALAARTLPRELQRKAIVWGTVGAILVRVLMTVVVVWLLQLPGLRLVGGALLIWIAWKLLAAEDGGDSHEVQGGKGRPASFWSALRTIVIADAVMGLDNVLGVAGAAKGSYLLVILIMIWGSTVILKWVERFPVIIYLGAGVLAWTAASMICHEPSVDAFLQGVPGLRQTIQALSLIAIVGGGYWKKRRRA